MPSDKKNRSDLIKGICIGTILGLLFSFRSLLSYGFIIFFLVVMISLVLTGIWLSVPSQKGSAQRQYRHQSYDLHQLPQIESPAKEMIHEEFQKIGLSGDLFDKAMAPEEDLQEKSYPIKWVTPQEVKALTELREFGKANEPKLKIYVKKAEEPQKSTPMSASEDKKSKIKFWGKETEESADDEDEEEEYDPDKDAEEYILGSKRKIQEDTFENADEGKKDEGDSFY